MQCEAAIYVGGCDDALQWAARCAHSIVNCANIDYPWASHCSRRWLNLKYRGSLNGRTWEQRMRSVTEFCLNALVNNEVLLLHCRVGRHRSGAFCSFLLAFMAGIDYEQGCHIYFKGRQGLTAHDQRVVQRADAEGGLQKLLEEFNSDAFCQTQRVQLSSRRCTPVPTPMPMQCPTSASACFGVPAPPFRKPMPTQGTASLAPSSSGVPAGCTPARKPRPPMRGTASLAPSSSGVRAPRTPVRKPMPRPSSSVKLLPPPPGASLLVGVPGLQELPHPPSPPRSRSRSRRRSGVPVRLQPAPPPHPPPLWRQAAPLPHPPPLRHAAPPPHPPPMRQVAQLQIPPPLRLSRLACAALRSAALSSCLPKALPKSPPPRSESTSSSRSQSPSQVCDTERAWQCPRCDSMNSRSAMFCASWRCEFPRPLLQEFKPGDWFCTECGNHNFRNRVGCNNTHCPTVRYKPGDWMCTRCGNHNYASRFACNTVSCRMQRPRRL